MIRQTVFYEAVCDRCGLPKEGYSWTDPEGVLEIALQSGWRQIDGRLLCWDCWEYDADEQRSVEVTP